MKPTVDFTVQIRYANWNKKLAAVVHTSDRHLCIYKSSCSFIRLGSACKAAQRAINTYVEKQEASVGTITLNDKVLYMETKEEHK